MENTFQHQEGNIYKYVPFSLNALRIIINSELYFGFPQNLNDPFECEFNFSEELKFANDNDLIDFLRNELKFSDWEVTHNLERLKTNPKILEQEVKKHFRATIGEFYGLTCFSENFAEPLLWSHYADSHKGFCLIFDSYILEESMNVFGTIKLKDIKYNGLPFIKPSISNKKLMLDNGEEIFISKMENWRYESEKRLINYFVDDGKNRYQRFDPKALKGIIFGSNIDKKDLDTLLSLTDKDSKYDLNWYQATKDTIKHSISIHQVYYTTKPLGLSIDASYSKASPPTDNK